LTTVKRLDLRRSSARGKLAEPGETAWEVGRKRAARSFTIAERQSILGLPRSLQQC
jgi:hypothetical protein